MTTATLSPDCLQALGTGLTVLVILELLALPLLLQGLFKVDAACQSLVQQKPKILQQLKALKPQIKQARLGLQGAEASLEMVLNTLHGGAAVRSALAQLNQWVWPKFKV